MYKFVLSIVTISLLITGECFMNAYNDKVSTTSVSTPPSLHLNHPIKVRYTNYRGETAVRTIVPMEVYVGKTEYHPHEQWLLKVWDVEKGAERIYALKDISQWFVE